LSAPRKPLFRGSGVTEDEDGDENEDDDVDEKDLAAGQVRP